MNKPPPLSPALRELVELLARLALEQRRPPEKPAQLPSADRAA